MNKKGSIWNPVFVSVFIANFCCQMGQQMMNTLVPKFADSLGAAASLVGVVTSMFAVSALLVRPFSGPAIDSFNKRNLLVTAQLFIIAGFIGYSLADRVEVIIAARLLHGVGVGFVSPLCLAIASNSLPDEKLGSGVGIYTLAQTVAQAIGPTIGLSLSAAIGYSKSFLVGAGIVGASCLLALLIKENDSATRPKFKMSLDKIVAKNAVKPSILMLLLGTSFACISSFLAIYGALRGVENIGLYFTAYAATVVITRPIYGKLLDRFGYDKILIPSILMFAASFFIISAAGSLSGFIAAGIVGAFGFGACQPTLQSLCMRCSPKEQRGAAGSTNYMGLDAGTLIGPIAAGQIIDAIQSAGGSALTAYSVMYRLMTIPMFLALVFLLAVNKSIKKDIAELDAARAAEAETNL